MGGRNGVERSKNSEEDTSEKVSYPTPPFFLDLVREVMPVIELDPASNPNSLVGAELTVFLPSWAEAIGLTDEEAEALGIIVGDGLAIDWGGLHTFDNPPYGLAHNRKWARKNADEAKKGSEIIALVPSAPGAKWFRPYRPKAYGGESDACCLWEGRIKFHGAPHPADFENAVIYFGPNPEKFRRVFGPKGWTT